MKFGFNTPFYEQLEFFRQKLNLPSEHWDDITREAHDRAFIVAGAQKADLLKDLNAAVTKAIEQGTGIEAFRKDFAAVVQKNGWTGWTGEGSKAGEAWRTKVIYQTNMATSYAAGRYRQLTDPDFITLRPYWRYVHNDSVMYPRPHHLHWGNIRLTLRHDHPFWKTHFPLNGWGCQCRVVPVEAPVDGDATEPPAGWNERDSKGSLPGIDKGFDYAPGRSVTEEMRALVKAKTAALPAPLGQALAQDAQQVLLAKPPVSIAEFIDAGRSISATLPDAGLSPQAFHEALIKRLAAEVGISRPAAVASRGEGARLVKEASQLFPNSWTAAADNFGTLYAKAQANARGGHTTLGVPTGPRARISGFGIVPFIEGNGFITVRSGSVSNAVHEFSHRLQRALPDLDAMFHQLHRERTNGDPLQRLRDITGIPYSAQEVARKDKYVNPYQGKEYAKGPLEVMTMAMEAVLGAGGKISGGWETPAEILRSLYTKDREMVDFVVGLLFHWKPVP